MNYGTERWLDEHEGGHSVTIVTIPTVGPALHVNQPSVYTCDGFPLTPDSARQIARGRMVWADDEEAARAGE